jgi:hypothetical protein
MEISTTLNSTLQLHFQDHIYLAQFKDDFILLDTKKDKYTICCKQFTNLLVRIIEEKKSLSDNDNLTGKQLPAKSKTCSTSQCSSSTVTENHSPGEENHFLSAAPQVPFQERTYISSFSSQDLIAIQNLMDDHVIEEKDSPYPFHIDRKVDSGGVSNVSWRLSLENQMISLNVTVLKAFITLLRVNFYIKIRGFYSMIQLIKKSRKNNISYTIPSMEELRKLANIVNKACLIYPTRTKCLEWAMTFVLLALKRGWKCNLEIGVQNYPFFAHAWVECDDKIVMDSQDLREGLAIILNEPFRKLKI